MSKYEVNHIKIDAMERICTLFVANSMIQGLSALSQSDNSVMEHLTSLNQRGRQTGKAE